MKTQLPPPSAHSHLPKIALLAISCFLSLWSSGFAALPANGVLIYVEPPATYVEVSEFTSITENTFQYSTVIYSSNGKSAQIKTPGIKGVINYPTADFSTDSNQTFDLTFGDTASAMLDRIHTLATTYPKAGSLLKGAETKWSTSLRLWTSVKSQREVAEKRTAELRATQLKAAAAAFSQHLKAADVFSKAVSQTSDIPLVAGDLVNEANDIVQKAQSVGPALATVGDDTAAAVVLARAVLVLNYCKQHVDQGDVKAAADAAGLFLQKYQFAANEIQKPAMNAFTGVKKVCDEHLAALPPDRSASSAKMATEPATESLDQKELIREEELVKTPNAGQYVDSDPSYEETVTYIENATGCKILWLGKYMAIKLKGHFPPRMALVDPTQMSPKDIYFNTTSVEGHATNKIKTVRWYRQMKKSEPYTRHRFSGKEITSSGISFECRTTNESTAKALSHLFEMCGGKDSSF